MELRTPRTRQRARLRQNGDGGSTHTLTFEGTRKDNAFWYNVVVHGTATDIIAQSEEQLDQKVFLGSETEWLADELTVISGFVREGTDRYEIDGDVVALDLGEGPDVTITWDGTDITGDPQQIVQPFPGNGDKPEPSANKLRLAVIGAIAGAGAASLF